MPRSILLADDRVLLADDSVLLAASWALMAIGVTEAWQRHSPHTESQSRPKRSSLTRYDGYPQKKEPSTRENFASELRAHSGETAYAYVLCDTPVPACALMAH